MRNPRHLTDTDGAADTDDAGIHDAIIRTAMMMTLLPVLEFLYPAGMAIDGGQYFQKRDKVALGKELL